jgi:diguanylate cyclase (GGDEF)-like protein
MEQHKAELQQEVDVKLISKPADDYRMVADAVLGIVKRSRKINDMKADQETVHLMVDRLIENATVDDMTGLPTWRIFNRDLEKLASQSLDRGDFSLAFIYVDIDGLKRINDDEERGGDERGDDLIRVVGATLVNSTRGVDRSYRRESGDEFGVLLQLYTNDITENLLSNTRDRFTNELDKALIEAQFPQDLYLGASVGIGVLAPDEDTHDFYRRVMLDMKEQKALHRERLAEQGIVFQDPRKLENS